MNNKWPDPQSFPAGSRWAAIVADLPGLVEELQAAWSSGDYSAAKFRSRGTRQSCRAIRAESLTRWPAWAMPLKSHLHAARGGNGGCPTG